MAAELTYIPTRLHSRDVAAPLEPAHIQALDWLLGVAGRAKDVETTAYALPDGGRIYAGRTCDWCGGERPDCKCFELDNDCDGEGC